jgi:hypothetical protein
MLNSVISTPGAKFMPIDLKDFYLCSNLPEYAYVRTPLHMIPPAIIELYNLISLIENGYVYVEVQKGMYGLPQAGKLANDALIKFLAPHGYEPCPVTHTDLMFTLVVDDFGVRYINKADVDRLLEVLQPSYKCSTDWTVIRYVGLTIAWDYTTGTCEISMPGYIHRALTRFVHKKTNCRANAPHPWAAPVYGARQQYEQYGNTPFMDDSHKLRLQEVLGYARAVDGTMIPAISTLATQQATPTANTMKNLT